MCILQSSDADTDKPARIRMSDKHVYAPSTSSALTMPAIVGSSAMVEGILAPYAVKRCTALNTCSVAIQIVGPTFGTVNHALVRRLNFRIRTMHIRPFV
jgi:hypothetical protein